MLKLDDISTPKIKEKLRGAFVDMIGTDWDIFLTLTFSPRRVLPFDKFHTAPSRAWISANKGAISTDQSKEYYGQFINMLNRRVGFQKVPHKRVVWCRATEFHDSGIAHMHVLLKLHKEIELKEKPLSVLPINTTPQCCCFKSRADVVHWSCISRLIQYLWSNKIRAGNEVDVRNLQDKDISEVRKCARYLAKEKNIGETEGGIQFSKNFVR